ncbi:MAG: hypothetical protein ABJB86_12235 [Bacteroidota bacterium]
MKILIVTAFAGAMFFLHTILPVPSSLPKREQPSALHNLFDSEGILDISLQGNVKGLLGNRSGDAQLFPMTMTYHDSDGSTGSFSINVKQRGHFRRIASNCKYPPLLLDFTKLNLPGGTLFSGQSQLKLVIPCSGDEYIVREWLVYKLYNILTPYSFKARLIKATLLDSGRQKKADPFYGILLEDDKQMAKRNNLILIKKKMAPQLTVKDDFLKMAMFEYLIGNTDWSVEYLQNINLLAKDTTAMPFAVPHDFDFSGIVQCPYSMPAEELEMSSIRERRYRGYCIEDIKVFDDTIDFYNTKKKDIYNLYSNCTLLDAKYIKSTLKYLDEFYSTINNAKQRKQALGYPCNPGGTGNVIIKGLKK